LVIIVVWPVSSPMESNRPSLGTTSQAVVLPHLLWNL
jgi:hypothetical protein